MVARPGIGPIFDNQLRQSQTDAAIARYDASVASYKQTVINGIREVEDNMALLRILEAEAVEQEIAVKFAREAVEQTENRYRAGISEYQNVVIVQSALLNAERNLLTITGRRFNASVALMIALGGVH
jgi:outer membrane protein TolC